MFIEQILKKYNRHIWCLVWNFYKANRYYINKLYEPDDIHQMASIKLFELFHLFDKKRGSIKTFINVVIKKEFKRILSWTAEVWTEQAWRHLKSTMNDAMEKLEQRGSNVADVLKHHDH